MEKRIVSYELKPNALIRAIFDLSPYAQKVLAVAIAHLGNLYKEPSLGVTFSKDEFLKVLGIEKGGHQHNLIRDAVFEVVDSSVKINTPLGDIAFPWFSQAFIFGDKFPSDNLLWKYDVIPKEGMIVLEFNPKLQTALVELKKAYTKLELANIGKLQSRYAIRWYEIAMSHKFQAGKDGNRPGEWFIPAMPVEEIRKMFGISEKKYPNGGHFRIKVIDNPITEINEANIGIWIEVVLIKPGRRILGYSFNCREVAADESRPVGPATETERIIERARRHPDWEAWRASVVKANPQQTLEPDEAEQEWDRIAANRIYTSEPEFFTKPKAVRKKGKKTE